MERTQTSALAALFVIAGVLGSFAFRKPADETPPAAPQTSFVERSPVAPPPPFVPAPSLPPAPLTAPPPASDPLAARMSPLDTVDRMPSLATQYPPPATSASVAPPAWNPPLSADRSPAEPPRVPRTYKLQDGDTLRSLAFRFLGNAERADELFAANADVLRDPDLLPIGQELRIPPRSAVPLSPPAAPPQPNPPPQPTRLPAASLPAPAASRPAPAVPAPVSTGSTPGLAPIPPGALERSRAGQS